MSLILQGLGDDEGTPVVPSTSVALRDPNMPRWLMASVRVHFAELIGATDVLIYEHTGPKDYLDMNGRPVKGYAELRVTGPYYRAMSLSEGWYDIDINVLCSIPLKMTNADEIERLIGLYYSLMTPTIGVFKYGNGPDDDGSQIGCLELLPQREGDVKVSRFGQANPDTQFIQATVEAQYRLKLFKGR